MIEIGIVEYNNDLNLLLTQMYCAVNKTDLYFIYRFKKSFHFCNFIYIKLKTQIFTPYMAEMYFQKN